MRRIGIQSKVIAGFLLERYERFEHRAARKLQVGGSRCGCRHDLPRSVIGMRDCSDKIHARGCWLIAIDLNLFERAPSCTVAIAVDFSLIVSPRFDC